MKKIISTVIEEMMLIMYLLMAGVFFSERIKSTEVLWIMGITTGIAIAIAKTIEVLVDYKVMKITDETSRAKRILRWWICFILISLVFFIAFNALEYYGNIPASNVLLVILSLGASTFHMDISLVLDIFIGANGKTPNRIVCDHFVDEDHIDDDMEIMEER